MVKNGNEMLEFQVLQALELDRQTYPQEYWLDEETVVKYLRRYPEIYTFAVDENNRLIGYLNMSCIDLASFEKILSGEESDICIGENNLCFPKKATANILYFSSIVVDKKYRGQGVASALFNKMAQNLKTYFVKMFILIK